jgi:transcriptional regulator with PAS, ATPase and Fis domain
MIKSGKFNLKSLAHILKVFSDEVDQMFILIDQNHQVQYCNQTYLKYFKLGKADVIGALYGRALSCKHFGSDGEFCGLSNYCEICEIKKNINLVFIRNKKKTEFDIVREFIIQEEKMMKHLKFKMLNIQLEKEVYILCIIKDLHETDKLKMLINPEESI